MRNLRDRRTGSRGRDLSSEAFRLASELQMDVLRTGAANSDAMLMSLLRVERGRGHADKQKPSHRRVRANDPVSCATMNV